MFQLIRTLAWVAVFTASPSECRKLYRIDAGDNHYSMETNTVNGFESLTKEDHVRNPFSFLEGEFSSSMSFSMSMDHRIPTSPSATVPISSPTTYTDKTGTSVPSQAPARVQIVPVSKTPTILPSGNPIDNPTTKPTSVEVNSLKLDDSTSDNMRHRTTFIGTLVVGGVAGLVAMALLILRAKRLNNSDIITDHSFEVESDFASK